MAFTEPIRLTPHPHRAGGALLAALTVLCAGCASTTRLDAQWSDPQLAPNSLRGARVLVACEAHDLVLKQICQDQLAAEVVARGGTPVAAPDVAVAGPGRAAGNEAYVDAARSARAAGIITHAVTVADVASSGGGSGVSIGIGGFGIGGGNVRGGVGVGVSVPVGGSPPPNNGYAISSRVSDAAGRLLFTAKASASPSADVHAQLAELTKAVFAGADKVPLF